MRTTTRRRDDWLVQQLPVGMAEDEFLVRFLRIFQDVADTVLVQIDGLAHQFDPTVAPDQMVRQLGAWIGIDWIDPSLDVRLQRRIVTEYAQILQWRGTARGLRRLMELVSGAPAVVRDSGGVHAEGESPGSPPHVHIEVESSGWATEPDLLRIVRAELPASVTFSLVVAGRTVWPPAPTPPPAAAREDVHA